MFLIAFFHSARVKDIQWLAGFTPLLTYLAAGLVIVVWSNRPTDGGILVMCGCSNDRFFMRDEMINPPF